MLAGRAARLHAAFFLSLQLAAGTAFGAPFTPGNLVVYRIGIGGTGSPSLVTTGNPVFLDEYTPAGVKVQSIALPTAASGANKALVASGTAAPDGLMTRSANGNCLAVSGYGRDLGTGAGNLTTTGTQANGSAIPRIVGRVGTLGTIDTTTALTDANLGSNLRGAASSDCASFWVSGTAASSGGGVRYAALGSTTSNDLTSVTFANTRGVLAHGNQLYVSASVTALRTVATVDGGFPTSGQQPVTRLPNLPNLSTQLVNAFFFARLNPASPGADTLYVADETSGIAKFSLVAGNWIANGTVGAAADVYRSVAAIVNAANIATVYAVRKGATLATGGGEIVAIADPNGFNGAFTNAIVTPTLLASAATNADFRGIALAPEVTITPSAGAHGTISPATPQIAGGGTTRSFTVTPQAGFSTVVGGTCGGSLSGNTFTTDPLSVNCTVAASFVAIPTYVATPIAGANGTLTPNTPRTLLSGATTSFSVTPNSGYAFSVGGTCGGSLAGIVYTIAPIAADCTVEATFTLITFTVTPSAGANGAITPSSPQTIPLTNRAVFNLTPDFGFGIAVGGSCGGSLSGTQYTTNPVTADCTVAATFPALPRYTVTPSSSGHGSITLNAPLVLFQGQSTSFTVTPDAGYNAAVRGTCGGTFSGDAFTIRPVSGDCTINVVFARKLVLFVGNSYTFGRVDPVMSYNTANVSDLTLAMWLANSTNSNADEPHPWGGIPGVFKKMTDQAGLEYDVSISARNAATLRGHYLNTNPDGWDLRGNIASQRWDIVMLQELSDGALPANRGANANLANFNTYVDKIERYVHIGTDDPGVPANGNARAAAEVYLYATWARPDMIGPNGTNADGQFYTAAEGLEAMTLDLHNAYFARAVANGNIEDVSAVGDAFLRAVTDGVAMRDPYVPEPDKVDLWHTDFFHPSKYGSYLSALVHFATITGLNPLSLGAQEQAAADLGIAADIAVKLQRVAQSTVLPDTTAPTTIASASEAPNAQGWYRGDVTVSFGATDNANGSGVAAIVYALSGAQAGGGTFGASGTVTISAEGVTTVTYYAVDRAGNAEAARTLSVAIDRTPPVTTAAPSDPPNAAGWNRSDVTVTFSAADNAGGSGVDSIRYTLAGAQSGAGFGTGGAVTITAEGVTTVTYYSTDRAGNVEAARTLRVAIERTSPVTTAVLSDPPNTAGWNRSDVTVTFSAADNAGGSGIDSIRYTLSGAQAGTGALGASGAVTISSEGVTTVTYYAVDRAGNLEATRTLRVAIDKTRPVTNATVSDPPNAAGWNRGDVTVSFSAADNPNGSGMDAVRYTLSGAQAGTGAFGTSGAVTISAEGVTTVTYYSTDRAGNVEAARALRVAIDKTAPVTAATVSDPPNAAGWNSADVTVSFSAADAPGGSGVEAVRYTLSGAQAGTGVLAASGAVTISSEGVTTVTYYAVDRAGNAEAARTQRIAIDRTAPQIVGMPGAACSLWPPNHKMVVVATIAAVGGVSPVTSFNVTAASSEAPMTAGQADTLVSGSGTDPRTVSLRAERRGTSASRVYTITATATDEAGNAASAVATCTVPHDQ